MLLLFLYNTGARAEEAASLKIGDVYLPKGKGLAVVSILGKGGKLEDALCGMILARL